MKHYLQTTVLAACLGSLIGAPAFAEGAQPATAAHAEQATNMFGGPVYLGEPALDVTAALVKAGGGADDFSFAAALVSMLGQETVDAEMAKLNKQYGEEEVKGFITGMDYAINSSLRNATERGIALPAPANLSGVDLAKALVKAGIAPDGVWWSGYMFDVAISHELHNVVMADINANVSYEADHTTHKVLNQAMYDVAQALGIEAKLASLH